MNLNSETETCTSEGSETKTSSEHEVRDDEMVTFDKTTVKVLQKVHFKLEGIKLVWGCITLLYKKISEIKLMMHFQ